MEHLLEMLCIMCYRKKAFEDKNSLFSVGGGNKQLLSVNYQGIFITVGTEHLIKWGKGIY